MSYHAKQNAGQRSFGLAFVVIFHIIIIWAFASGLGARLGDKLPEILKVKQVEEQQQIEKVEPPPPPPPDKAPPPENIPLPPIDFVIDAPAPQAQITVTHKDAPAPVAQAPMTKAKPDPKKFSPPEYPPAAIRLAEEGVTGLNIYVLEDGKVGDIQIRQSSGSERLDEAVVKHGKRAWKFIPCMQGDKAVACWFQINYRWKLEDAKK